MNYSIIGNKLIVNEIPIEFSAPIYKAELFNNLLIVMLEWQSGNPLDFTNALYAVSEKGTILWQMQNVREIMQEREEPDPLVDFRIADNIIYASDYSSRRFFINPKNGKIFNRDVIGW